MQNLSIVETEKGLLLLGFENVLRRISYVRMTEESQPIRREQSVCLQYLFWDSCLFGPRLHTLHTDAKEVKLLKNFIEILTEELGQSEKSV